MPVNTEMVARWAAKRSTSGPFPKLQMALKIPELKRHADFLAILYGLQETITPENHRVLSCWGMIDRKKLHFAVQFRGGEVNLGDISTGSPERDIMGILTKGVKRGIFKIDSGPFEVYDQEQALDLIREHIRIRLHYLDKTGSYGDVLKVPLMSDRQRWILQTQIDSPDGGFAWLSRYKVYPAQE